MVTGIEYRKNNSVYKEGEIVKEKLTNGEENED
jgi:hypothetical protein